MRGLTYSEFDNIEGPVLRFCYPSSALSNEVFESLSDYAIVGQHLCGKFIAVKTESMQFLSYPVAISNPKYHRNRMLFSCGIVLDLDTNIDPYENMLRKISTTLVSLELEQELLFNPANKNKKVPQLLRMLYESIQSSGEAFITIDPYNTLSVRLFAPIEPPRPLGEYEVPIMRYDKRLISNLPWDVTLQHVLPMVDGSNFIKRIAFKADMDVDSVKRSLRVLLFYNCIIMTDIFRYSNRYQLMPGALKRLLDESNTLLVEMEDFCTMQVDQREALVGWFREAQGALGGGLRSRSDSYASAGSYSESSLGNSFPHGSSSLDHHDPPPPVAGSFGSRGHSPMSSSPSMNHPGGMLQQNEHHQHQQHQQQQHHKQEQVQMRITGIARFLLRLRTSKTVLEALGGQVVRKTTTSAATAEDSVGDGKDEGTQTQQPKVRVVRQKSLLPYLEGVDLGRLIAFAQNKGLIRRMYEFPVRGCWPSSPTAAAAATGGVSEVRVVSGAEDEGKVGPVSAQDYAAYLEGEVLDELANIEQAGGDDLEEVDEEEEEEEEEDGSVISEYGGGGLATEEGERGGYAGGEGELLEEEYANVDGGYSSNNHNGNGNTSPSSARKKQLAAAGIAGSSTANVNPSASADIDGEEEYLFMADDMDQVFGQEHNDHHHLDEGGDDDEDDESGSRSHDDSYDSEFDSSNDDESSNDSYNEDNELLDDDFGSEHSDEGGRLDHHDTHDEAQDAHLFAAKLREKQMKDVAGLHGQVCLDAFCVGTGVDPSTVLSAPNVYVMYKASPLG